MGDYLKEYWCDQPMTNPEIMKCDFTLLAFTNSWLTKFVVKIILDFYNIYFVLFQRVS